MKRFLGLKQNRRSLGAGGLLNLGSSSEQDSSPTGKAAENDENNDDAVQFVHKNSKKLPYSKLPVSED